MDTFSPPAGRLSPAEISRRAQALGDRFQNIDLGGVWTAPNRFPGDHPGVKYARFSDAIPRDVSGQTVLAIGCNAGFYSVEMKRRGAARVLGVESDERSLVQARFAAEMLGLDTEYRALSVYDVARLGEKFDVVIFMGVLYHLRHPLRARELIQRARRPGFAGVPIHAAWRHQRPAARSGGPGISGHRDVRAAGFPGAVLHRTAVLRRSEQLVDSQPGLRRGDAAPRRF